MLLDFLEPDEYFAIQFIFGTSGVHGLHVQDRRKVLVGKTDSGNVALCLPDGIRRRLEEMVGAPRECPLSGFFPVFAEPFVHSPLSLGCLDDDGRDGKDVLRVEYVLRGTSVLVHHDLEGVPDDVVIPMGKVQAEFPGTSRYPGPG